MSRSRSSTSRRRKAPRRSNSKWHRIRACRCGRSPKSPRPVGTLVFDEVDAGIGGAVAQTIGRSLKRLGKERQVLCVTHLPQVAASADAQWSVAKSAGLKIRLQRLDRAARIEELARMLGGAETTARKHAAELLDG